MTRQALFRLKLKGIHRYIRDSEVYDEIVTTLSSTDMTDPTIKKMQKRPKLVKKTKKTIYRADTHPFERAVQRRVENFISKLAKFSGASQK